MLRASFIINFHQSTANVSVYSGGAGRLDLSTFVVYHHGDTRGNRGVCSKLYNPSSSLGKHSRFQLLLTNALSRRNVSSNHPACLLHGTLPRYDVNNGTVLQDPSVAASSVDNKISFLRTKNLTQEEIEAALARAGGSSAVAVAAAPYPSAPPPQGPPQQYYQPYPQYAAWQPPAAAPKRDWRDWFIMATVVGGVSYGLYSVGKVGATITRVLPRARLTRE